MKISHEELKKPTALTPITYGQKIVQLGSCFSTNISQKLRAAGFSVVDNPFGVIFHPTVLAHQIQHVLSDEFPDSIVQKDDVFLHYNASGTIYGMSEIALRQKMKEQAELLKTALLEADYLMVTFGSALGYTLKTNNQLVANCHQQPAHLFEKQLTSVTELTATWESALSTLKKVNPNIKIVFTVSPVRYSREGWIENNRSKARLIALCENMSSVATYFPSYELVIDLLRDYRYFEADEVHPNAVAINQVWDLFQTWFFTDETRAICMEVNKIRAMEAHRFLYPESIKVIQFNDNLANQKAALLARFPAIVF
jgi:hypothetical protein